jgi:membrane-associated protease RseP (regulator of RpoE activity)
VSYALGVALFAVAIGLSIALHEFGHLLTAKAFGMKAVRYFVGFGPTLWSFRRGETEYGIKAIPAGGYVKIVGMTHLEEVPPEDRHRAFWRYPVWQRLAVMSAGSVTHLVVAVVVLYATAVSAGLPFGRAVVGEVQACVVAQGQRDGTVRDCQASDPASPAAGAGLRPGDRVVGFDGHRVDTWSGFVRAIRARPDRTVDLRYVRDGTTRTTRLHVPAVYRAPLPGERADPRGGLARVGAIGVAPAATEHFGPLGSVAATARYTGSLVSGTFAALARFPGKVPELVGALLGQHRDPDSPVSVVGASRVGGQAAAAGSWLMFLLLLAGFNVFVGVFNLFPLLPLDGGHVAVLLFERARSRIARALGRPDPGHVDLNRLAPITLVVIIVFGGISLLTILADVVNPIQNPFR